MKRHLSPREFDDLLRGYGTADTRAHAETCPRCREIWQEVVLAHTWLSRAQITPAPAEFHARVMQTVATEDRNTPYKIPVSRVVWAFGIVMAGTMVLAITVLVAGILFLALHNTWQVFTSTLALIGSVLMQVWKTVGAVVWLLMRNGGTMPWMAGMLLTATLLLAFSVWLTRFYSRKLYTLHNR